MGSMQRAGHFVLGLIMLICSVLLLVLPNEGMKVVVVVLGFSLLVYGIQKIVFYLRMARHMVGGLSTLFVGIIAIDAGAFTFTLSDQPQFPIVIYLVSYYGYMGVVNLLRFSEGKRLGTAWVKSLIHGILSLVLVVAGIASMGSTDILVVIVAIALVYSALRHMSWAFRRTDVIFIQ